MEEPVPGVNSFIFYFSLRTETLIELKNLLGFVQCGEMHLSSDNNQF